jgi:predicted dienelactone hydrolase
VVAAVAAGLAGCSPAPDGGRGGATGVSAGIEGRRPPTPAPASTSTTSTTIPPLADPAGPGRYAVGRSTSVVTAPARDDRALAVDVWYPVPPGTDGEPSAYELPGDISIRGAALHEPDAAPGAFPLMVFSHGGSGLRFQNFSLAEVLASHGFVVAAPDHAGNTVHDQIEGTGATFDEVAVDRPLDVSLVIDWVAERVADSGDPLAGAADVGAVGVVGHSLGGFTALAAAGGTDSVEADERVAAVVPIAPLSSLLTDENLQAVRVPALFVGGTADHATPITPDLARPFLLAGAPAYRVDVVGASHWSFTDICQIRDTLTFADLEPEVERLFAVTAVAACTGDALPAADAKRLTNHHVVAFLRVHLAGDERYAAHLQPLEGVEVHLR